MRLLLALLVLLSTGGMALAQHNAVTLTKIEARAMTPEALTRRIFGGLAPLMLPIADRGQPGVAPTRPLTRLFFYTRPTVAMAAGMCRTELGSSPAIRPCRRFAIGSMLATARSP